VHHAFVFILSSSASYLRLIKAFYADIIDELVKNGKEIEAVYFASESGLTERFQPIKLLESYVRNYKNNIATILMNGNNSQAATVWTTTFSIQFHIVHLH
jgi:hypothetical protein